MFEDLKKTSFKKIQKRFLLEEKAQRENETSDKYFVRDRVIESLQRNGNLSLANKIQNCRKGNICSSLWCIECRKRIVANYKGHLLRDASRYNFTNDDLNLVTFHLGVCNVDASEVKILMDSFSQFFSRVKARESRKNISEKDFFWFSGIFEIELVNWPMLLASDDDESSVKIQQIQQLIDSYGGDTDLEDVFVYVHVHAISNQDVSNWIRGKELYFDGQKHFRTNEYGCHVMSFHSNKSVEENLTRLASYFFKNPSRFKHSFIGDNKNARGEKMTCSELSGLVALYDSIQGKHHRSLTRNATVEYVSRDIWGEFDKE